MLEKYGFTQVSKTVWTKDNVKVRLYKNTFTVDDDKYDISRLDEILGFYVNLNESVLEKINRRERQILVHSYIYYKTGSSIVSDDVFDKFAYDLVALMESNPTEFKASVYHKDFIGFDGSTGYNLPYTYSEIINKGEYLLSLK